MKKSKLLIQTVFSVVLAMTMFSCAKQNIEEVENLSEVKQTFKMKLVGQVDGFDGTVAKTDKPTTKADDSTWKDGDKLYISFLGNSSLVSGEAVYIIEDSTWTVSAFGTLKVGTSQKCEVRFFDGAEKTTSSVVNLLPTTAIYEDTTASYSFSDKDELVVYATLKPKTSRIAFKGTNNTKFGVLGLRTCRTFDPVTNKFSYTEDLQKTSISSNGSSSYIYGTLAKSNRRLYILHPNGAFTRYCNAEILKDGKSGYMNLPTEDNHTNWRTGLVLEAEGIDFTMIPLVGYGNSNSKIYLIGETEVTESLYKTINGKSSTSQLPQVSITQNEATSFMSKLSESCKLSFTLPENDVWYYAYKGGKYTKGYTYSGSNTRDEVSWYPENASSLMNVKQKMPNELGIYDMDGNAAEWTRYSSYTYYYMGTSYLNIIYSADSSGSCSKNSDGKYMRNDIGFRLSCYYSF